MNEIVSPERNSDVNMVGLIDPSKDQRWDEFVQNHPLGWVTHLSAWMEVLEDSFHHIKGHCLATFDNKNNIKAILPLFYVKSWLTGRRLVSTPFATLSDPLFYEIEDRQKLLDEAVTYLKKPGISFMEIRCFLSEPAISDSRFNIRNFYKHHYIHLNRDPEELKKSFHRTCVRQRISRAMKSDLSLSLGKNIGDLNIFYSLYVLTRKRVGLPPLPYMFLKSLWNTFYSSGKIQLLLAEHEGNAIAGLILLKWKDRVSAEFAASNDEFLAFSPNHFLFWEAIKISFSEGYKFFDFGRTSPNNKSLMDFKGHWATTVIDLPQYYYYEKKPQGSLTSEGSKAYKALREACKIMPDPCLKLLGQLFYRHLG